MVLAAWRASAYSARRDRLAARLRQSITVERWTGQDAYGVPTYAAPVTVMAQVAGVAQLVRSADGAERASNTTLIVPGDTTIDAQDRLTLPDGTHPAIIAITTAPDQAGALVKQIYT